MTVGIALVQGYFSVDGARAALVLAFAFGQAAMAYWPSWAGWPETIASRSETLRNPVVPIDWAFAIWGPIFISCLAFGVWQLLPGNLDHPASRQIGWLAAALFACNVAWEAYVPKRDIDSVSVVIILIELALALAIVVALSRSASRPPTTEFWLVHAPFQLLAGWLSAAAFVNVASALQRSGVAIKTGLSTGMIAGAGILGAGMAWLTGGWIYAAAIAWALLGLVVANWSRERRPAIAVLAALMIPVVLAAAGLSRASWERWP